MLRQSTEEMCFLQSFKVHFVSLIVEGFFLHIAPTGVSRELQGDRRSALAQDCTSGTSDNSRAECFHLQHRSRILDWLLSDPASCWLSSWLWLWLNLWKLGPRLLTQPLALISGPLLSPPPQWKPLPLSPSPPLPLSLFRFPPLLLMN